MDPEFINKLVQHAQGLEADADDLLLGDVQVWLVAHHRLVKSQTVAPCGPDCMCADQLENGEGIVTCYREPGQLSVVPGRTLGRVKFYHPSREYGFVVADGTERDIFLHRRYIGSMTAEQLFDGARVSFTTQDCKKGLRVTSILPVEE